MKIYINIQRKDAEQHNQKVNKSERCTYFHWAVSIPKTWKTNNINKGNMFFSIGI